MRGAVYAGDSERERHAEQNGEQHELWQAAGEPGDVQQLAEHPANDSGERKPDQEEAEQEKSVD